MTDSLVHFQRLISAALTLSVAGLKNDDTQTPGKRFQFEVPCSPGREARRVNGAVGHVGLRTMVDWICTHSGAIAPHLAKSQEAHVLNNSYGLVIIHAPRAVSAHEVVESAALLFEAFQSWGIDPHEINRAMELR